QRRCPLLPKSQAERHSLRRCRNQRGCLGPRTRPLHDDWRPERGRAATQSNFEDARPRHRRHPSHSRPRETGRNRGKWLHPLRSIRFRPFRKKMVHNGIEYGIMQAYAEGFDIFKNANSQEIPEDLRYDLNLPDIAEVWRRGSVVSSWLFDLTAMALTE